jgi:hypothetical protein
VTAAALTLQRQIGQRPQAARSAAAADGVALADKIAAWRQTSMVAIVTGGIIEECGQPRLALRDVIAHFRLRECDEDYAVDIAFRSWTHVRFLNSAVSMRQWWDALSASR